MGKNSSEKTSCFHVFCQKLFHGGRVHLFSFLCIFVKFDFPGGIQFNFGIIFGIDDYGDRIIKHILYQHD